MFCPSVGAAMLRPVYAAHKGRWLVIEADAITNLDYTASRVVSALIEDLARQKNRDRLCPSQHIVARRYGSARRHCRYRRGQTFR